MKIAVLSDIHGNIPALEVVAEDIKQKKVDLIFNLGDHISGPLWLGETIEFLMKQDWIHIAGNHDRNLIDLNFDKMGLSDQYASRHLNEKGRKWLNSLPAIYKDGNILGFHGTPSNNNLYLLETVWNGRARLSTPDEIRSKMGGVESQVILCGHTHIPRIISYKSSIIINPGSVGLQAYDDTEPEYHIMETGTNQTCYAVLDMGKNISAELVFLPYDHKSAVIQALKNDRPDWAKGLESGYISK